MNKTETVDSERKRRKKRARTKNEEMKNLFWKCKQRNVFIFIYKQTMCVSCIAYICLYASLTLILFLARAFSILDCLEWMDSLATIPSLLYVIQNLFQFSMTKNPDYTSRALIHFSWTVIIWDKYVCYLTFNTVHCSPFTVHRSSLFSHIQFLYSYLYRILATSYLCTLHGFFLLSLSLFL